MCIRDSPEGLLIAYISQFLVLQPGILELDIEGTAGHVLPGEIRLRFHDIAKGHVQAVQNLRAARHRNQVVGLRIKGGDHAVTAVILRAVAEQQIHVAV